MEEVKETEKENLASHVRGFAETYVKLAVAKTTQKSADLAATGITGAVCLLLILLILFFTGIGFAMWLGESLANPKAGYFIVAASFGLVALILYLSRKQWLYPIIQNSIIKKTYD